MKQCLYILCGIPFSGKSTLAKAIVEKTDHIRVDLDEIKFELFGNKITDTELKQEDWDLVYQKMYQKIEDLLKKGKTIVHDTGNFTKHERDLVRQIADKLGIQTITIFIDTPKEVAFQRLLENRKSKTRFDVDDTDFESTVAEMEIPSEEDTVVFHYNEPIEKWINNVLTKEQDLNQK